MERIVSSRTNALVCLLRCMGLIDCLALVAVIAPDAWMAACHEYLGLGPFPGSPITVYLARSISMWFALFGLMLWYLSCNVARHAGAIEFIGWAMIMQGLAMFGVDCSTGMPTWWTLVEGPTCIVLGTAIVGLIRSTIHRDGPAAAG